MNAPARSLEKAALSDRTTGAGGRTPAGRRWARRFESLFLILSDLGALTGGMWLVGLVLGGGMLGHGWDGGPAAHDLAVAVVAIAWLGQAHGHYSRRRGLWDEVRQTTQALTAIFALEVLLTAYASGDAGVATPGILTNWLSAVLLLPACRVASRRLMMGAGLWWRPTVVLGTESNAIAAVGALGSDRSLGFRIVGLIADQGGPLPEPCSIEIGAERYPIHPGGEDLDRTLAALGEPHVVVALESLVSREAQRLVRRLALERDDLTVIPPLQGLPALGTELLHVFSHELMFLDVRNNLLQRRARFLKRSFDIVAALALLVVLAPLLAPIALYLNASGAVLFSHRRVGRHGHEFPCYKFRSMVPDAERMLARLLAADLAARREWELDHKLRDDPRVTPFGRFLRRSSLDELPQLWNVLRGEMSLVGPRPVVRCELERYGEAVDYYLQVRPGITGLWQVLGRSDTTYEERVRFDTWYVRNWSLWYDLVILAKTFGAVLRRTGAH